MISGNEKVDLLANDNRVYSTKINRITTTEATKNIKNKLIETWQYHWNNIFIHPSNKLRIVKLNVKKIEISPDITRMEKKLIIIRARTYPTNPFLPVHKRTEIYM